jgi:hypothetical protein
MSVKQIGNFHKSFLVLQKGIKQRKNEVFQNSSLLLAGNLPVREHGKKKK